jgi:hypothetical protein
MAAHKWPGSLRIGCTRSGSSVAAIPVYQSVVQPVIIKELVIVTDRIESS